MANYREYKLDNGLFVALQETPTQTFAGRLRVWQGSLAEKPGEEGLAHFLEHTLVSCGSQNYDPKQVYDIKTSFCGNYGAYTALDRTCFQIDTLAEDLPLFLAYVSDTILNPIFADPYVEAERGRILREIADKKSHPSFMDDRRFIESVFGRESPLSRLNIGSEYVVASASVDDIKNFHGRGYCPNNMDLVLVGGLPPNIDELIEQNFGHFKPGNETRYIFPRSRQLEGRTFIHTYAPELLNQENHSESSADLALGFNAPTSTDSDNATVDLLVQILGGTHTSRLFNHVSTKKGLAYGIGAKYEDDNNNGFIIIHGKIHAERDVEAIPAVFEEMYKLQTELVPLSELNLTKRNTHYNIVKTFESNSGHIRAIDIKLERNETAESWQAKIEAVTPEDIMGAARKYFPDLREGNYVLMLRDPLKER